MTFVSSDEIHSSSFSLNAKQINLDPIHYNGVGLLSNICFTKSYTDLPNTITDISRFYIILLLSGPGVGIAQSE
jgi:hypothetical protein